MILPICCTCQTCRFLWRPDGRSGNISVRILVHHSALADWFAQNSVMQGLPIQVATALTGWAATLPSGPEQLSAGSTDSRYTKALQSWKARRKNKYVAAFSRQLLCSHCILLKDHLVISNLSDACALHRFESTSVPQTRWSQIGGMEKTKAEIQDILALAIKVPVSRACIHVCVLFPT